MKKREIQGFIKRKKIKENQKIFLNIDLLNSRNKNLMKKEN